MNSDVILDKIGFVNRYSELCNQFHFQLTDRFEKFSIEEVISIITELGYDAKYVNSDKFFRVLNIHSNIKFQFNIVLKGGVVELIWGVWANNEPVLELSGPWNILAENKASTYKFRKPIFRNYEDLRKILNESFSIYEAFKIEVQKQETK